ncbi:TRAP transporter large permease [Alkalihalobacillus oceani]|uniref:TRAP transporter large permease n=1 Tax=Halalkalibacter oceani TaxID=1653776 RepID=UPI00203C111E|nr:TRAP transporter large permease [Halalkalibacter oceani]MCM3759898.1 TRAP transporter large permease [Halalkalibacter oceani]
MDFWLIFPLVVVFFLFIIKVPVAYAMLISSLTYFLFNAEAMSTQFLTQRLVATMESFIYLAIPFFTCAGVVFNYSGITSRLIRLAIALVGHLKGGMGHVNIVLSTMMGGLSGSANADAAMQSKVIVPEMTKLGYSKSFSTVVTSASSVITPIIPPGIILILYATAANVSIEQMFYAGYIPGLVMMAGLMILTRRISIKREYKPVVEKRATVKELLSELKKSIWALMMPLGIIMGLRFGIFTPTEAGAISIVYAFIIGKFIYKELKISDIKYILLESTTISAGIMFILASAQVFGSYLTWERIPMMISEALTANISDPWMFLLIVNIMLIVIGYFFDGGAAMILLAPLLVPTAIAMDIDLVHFGIVMCINLAIAGFSPPFGSMMFVTTSITNTKVEDYIKESWPYLAVLVLVLLILTYLPQVTMFLPNLLS